MHLRRNCVEQERKHGGAVGGNAGHLRLDGLAERPPLHLGLEPHVGDLQAEAVPIHAAAGGVVGVGVEVLEKASGPGLSTGRLLVAVGLTCQARRGLQPAFLRLSSN